MLTRGNMMVYTDNDPTNSVRDVVKYTHYKTNICNYPVLITDYFTLL